jgi:hypothetical protein
VQSVDTTGAEYPVVADPDVTYNCGLTSCNATFSRFYTANVLQPSVGSGGTVAGILAGGLMCGKIPSPPFAAACAAAVAVTYVVAVADINEAKAKNRCFSVRFNYLGAVSPVYAISFGVVNDNNCKNSEGEQGGPLVIAKIVSIIVVVLVVSKVFVLPQSRRVLAVAKRRAIGVLGFLLIGAALVGMALMAVVRQVDTVAYVTIALALVGAVLVFSSGKRSEDV